MAAHAFAERIDSTPPHRAPSSRVVVLRDGTRVMTRGWHGRGEPIVLLHGLLASSEAWDELCLAFDRPCVAIDLPGFGSSDSCPIPRVSAFARILIETVDALGIDRFALVGHSLGGAVAVAAAERLPDRVTALVLVAPAGFGRLALAEAVSLPGVRSITDRVVPHALSRRILLTLAYRLVIANGNTPEAAEIDRVLERGAELAPGVRSATRAVAAAGLSPRAFHRRRVAYDGPVTVLWGDRDRLVPSAHRHGVLTAFPHAEVVLWRDVGHHPLRERPAELVELVAAACGTSYAWQPAASPSRSSSKSTGRSCGSRTRTGSTSPPAARRSSTSLATT